MKKLIAELPTLISPMKGKKLMVYLPTANEAVSVMLLVETSGRQMPIHYVSRSLQGAKVNYISMKKLALALLLEECLNCVYGNGKPLTFNECGGILRGGFCLPWNLKAENSFNCYQDAYSFNDPSNNSNYLPQPQYENYLCNLCGYNSHDGYEFQQQCPFVYEQEPSYNQNYNDNYYPYDSPSFACCDNCGKSHETFQCQPINQNVDFSGSDQIQTPQYPDVHHPSQEINEEAFHAKEDLMKSIQNFLEECNCIPFEEKPPILLEAWFKFFAIKRAQPEDSNELF
uniref:Reverse transcriptase domain-containing protein n=1 Tax=Tanacetum cinerariifolium TaxID=118510 RepID=A0A699H6W4_TANCI|nr:reverse transcriptase domain-containing protein [Tanacetum cinerariifolium]